MARTIFQEEQKFKLLVIVLPLIVLSALAVVWFIMQIGLGQSIGNNPISDIGMIIFCVTVWSGTAMILAMRLSTRIDEMGITMHFFPFVKRKWSWAEVKSAEVLDYGFVGGWGIRLWTSYGTVYNIRGSKGLALKLANGKKVLIGTQKPEEMKAAVSAYHATAPIKI